MMNSCSYIIILFSTSIPQHNYKNAVYTCVCVCIVHTCNFLDQVFEGSRHEVLHDKDQERAREVLKDWVLAHLTVSVPSSQPKSAQSESAEVEGQKTVEEQLDTRENEPKV